MNDELVPYRQGMDYGVGIDTPSGDARNAGVVFETTEIEGAGGSIVTFSLSRIETDEDLQESLGLSASASGGIGLFSASASMNFAKACHVHNNSVFLLASVEVSRAFRQIRKPRLDEDAKRVLAEEGADSTRFREMYGDVFVRGIQTGGRFFACVEVITSSSTDQNSVAVAVKGSSMFASAEMNFSSDFKRSLENKSLKITVHHEGGDVPTEPTSLEEVQKVASTFAATVKDAAAVPYAVLVDKYTILDIPKGPNLFDLGHQQEVLTFCAQRRNAIWTALNNVNFVFDNLGQFEIASYDMVPLVAYRDALEKDLEAVMSAGSNAQDHPKGAKMPVLTAKPVVMPQRRAGEEDTLAAIGERMAASDPLIAMLRDAQPTEAARRGFYVGLATEANNTLWGPGAQSIMDGLRGDEQIGFKIGANYCLQRNNNKDFAARGAAIAKADPAVAAARALDQPASLYWLGFDIGTGIFGDPARGAQGNTLMGPGSERIRASLDGAGQRGFDAARDFNLKARHVLA